ncbi:hypothetical protein NX059_003773 [Plenodomus lindquistii]|nr:hypothetical protein NX059_003773 [Plenodomus lindquistii]
MHRGLQASGVHRSPPLTTHSRHFCHHDFQGSWGASSSFICASCGTAGEAYIQQSILPRPTPTPSVAKTLELGICPYPTASTTLDRSTAGWLHAPSLPSRPAAAPQVNRQSTKHHAPSCAYLPKAAQSPPSNHPSPTAFPIDAPPPA